MTISFGLLLAIAAYLCVKMKGAQWYVIFLGVMIGRSVTPGGALDNAIISAMTAVESGLSSLVASFGNIV